MAAFLGAAIREAGPEAASEDASAEALVEALVTALVAAAFLEATSLETAFLATALFEAALFEATLFEAALFEATLFEAGSFAPTDVDAGFGCCVGSDTDFAGFGFRVDFDADFAGFDVASGAAAVLPPAAPDDPVSPIRGRFAAFVCFDTPCSPTAELTSSRTLPAPLACALTGELDTRPA
ncbi:hypothetical protein [Streptomyces roseicoloratus]|uniref:hypothetical protein n=1 Tax=Streptomyces roseicoloratus TaxID=2508722 RepID=UPI00403D59FE